MRNGSLFFFAFAIVCILTTLPSCRDPKPSPEEKFLGVMAGSWISSSKGVTLDNVAVNNVFNGFTITFTKESAYTTQNGNAPIWPASGSFTLTSVAGATSFTMKRTDGVEVTIVSPSADKLTLEFQYVGKSSRQNSVSGKYVFDLVRKP
ncbi:MAG: hypothetical protein ACOYW3_09205 [Bacteroidota bacterium]